MCRDCRVQRDGGALASTSERTDAFSLVLFVVHMRIILFRETLTISSWSSKIGQICEAIF